MMRESVAFLRPSSGAWWRGPGRSSIVLAGALGALSAGAATAAATGIAPVGARGEESSALGLASGIYACSASPLAGSAGLVGEARAVTGASFGVAGTSLSPLGVAGRFEGVAGSTLVRGLASGVEVFSVSGAGVVAATAFAGSAASLAYGDLECVGCVDGSELAPGSIAASRLAAGSVGPTKLADGAVGAAEVAAGAVTRPKIAPGAVGTAELAAGSVTSAKLAAGAVLAAHLGANAVTATGFAVGSVDTSRIQGTERIIYNVARSCDQSESAGMPTRNPFCWTNACTWPNSGYHDCDYFAPCVGIPMLCFNDDFGWRVLSPDILP